MLLDVLKYQVEVKRLHEEIESLRKSSAKDNNTNNSNSNARIEKVQLESENTFLIAQMYSIHKS
jgi:hypothetical protein